MSQISIRKAKKEEVRYILAVINDTPVGSLMLLVNGAIGTAVGIYGSKACMYHQLTAGMAFTRPCMTKS